MTPLPLNRASLGGADFIERLVHLGGDVGAVQDIEGVWGIALNHVQIRFPHSRADELEETASFLAQPDKEFAKTFLFSLLGDREEAFGALVDLVDEGQELAFLPGDLINSGGGKASQIDSRPTPVNRHLDGAKNGFPARLKGARRFLPTESLRPNGRETRQSSWSAGASPKPKADVRHECRKGGSTVFAAHNERRRASPTAARMGNHAVVADRSPGLAARIAHSGPGSCVGHAS